MIKRKKSEKHIDPKWQSKYTRNPKFWNNQGEYKKVGELEERFQILREYKESSCIWGVDGGMFQDWTDRQDFLTKLIIGWRREDDPKDPRPNLKSPHAWNSIQVALSELYDLNLLPAATPWTEKGMRLAPVVENIAKYPIIRYDYNNIWNDAMEEGLWFGNSFLDVDYVKIKRTGKFKKLKGFTDKESKMLEKGEPAIYETEDYYEHNDVDWKVIPFDEIYIDDFARTMHGLNHAANDVIWERILSYDQFLSEFEGRRGYKNIDKVVPGGDIRDENTPIFKFPSSMENTDNVIVKRWQVKSKDLVRYTANGVWLGDFPLPNYKQLSTVHIKCFNVPNHLFGIGLADMIAGYQIEDEQVRNKFLEILDIALAPPIIANNQVAGEFNDQYDPTRYRAGEVISISGSPSEIQWMSPAITRLSEMLSMRAQLKEDVISVSLIDPKASALPTQSPTAFEAFQMTQATMKSFSKTLKSFSRGIKKGLQIQWALQRQEYPLALEPEAIEKRKGDKGNKMLKSRSIFTKDIEIVDQGGKIITKQKTGMHPFKVKDAYFDLEDDDIDIILSPESQIPMSKASRAKNTEQMMAQLFPILAQDAQIKQIPPMEYEPILEMLRNYIRSHDGDEDILQTDKEDKEESIERAKEQERLMWKNIQLPPEKQKKVMGEFDEPVAHRNHHMKTLAGIKATIARLEVETQAEEQVGQAGVAGELLFGLPTQNMMPADAQSLFKNEEKLGQYKEFYDELLAHLEVDKMTEEQAEEKFLSEQLEVEPGQTPMPTGDLGGSPGSLPPGGLPIPDIPGPQPSGEAEILQQIL
jgi:hypothetical protein